MIPRAILLSAILSLAYVAPAAAYVKGVQDDRVILGDVAARPQAFAAGRMAGARVWRIIVPWNRVEVAPNRYDTAWLTQAVNEARASGYRVLLTVAGTPTAPPPWRVRPGYRTSWGFDSNFKVTGYVKLVRAIARATRGKIALYTFVNEPDWYGLPPCYMARIFKRSSRALRLIDRHARPVWGDSIGANVIRYTRRARRCGLHARRLAWHYGDAGTIRRIRHAFRHAHLLITEWGVPVKAGDAAGGLAWDSLLKQARRSRLALVTAYHVTDPKKPRAWNTSMLRPDGSPRAAFVEFARARG